MERLKAALSRKVGPFTVGAWILIVVVGVGIGLAVRRRFSGSSSGGGEGEFEYYVPPRGEGYLAAGGGAGSGGQTGAGSGPGSGGQEEKQEQPSISACVHDLKANYSGLLDGLLGGPVESVSPSEALMVQACTIAGGDSAKAAKELNKLISGKGGNEKPGMPGSGLIHPPPSTPKPPKPPKPPAPKQPKTVEARLPSGHTQRYTNDRPGGVFRAPSGAPLPKTAEVIRVIEYW